jgi:hypothetical protein
MQYLKTVYSHLKNKKKELKRFSEYINANNSLNFRILVKKKMINRITSSSSRLAASCKLTKILDICILIINKRINTALFIELNLIEFIKYFLLVHSLY